MAIHLILPSSSLSTESSPRHTDFLRVDLHDPLPWKRYELETCVPHSPLPNFQSVNPTALASSAHLRFKNLFYAVRWYGPFFTIVRDDATPPLEHIYDVLIIKAVTLQRWHPSWSPYSPTNALPPSIIRQRHLFRR